KVSQKILNTILLFKNIITTVVAFNPIYYTASAWAVVSLRLIISHITINPEQEETNILNYKWREIELTYKIPYLIY
ncbi:hypothetical protein P170DRAFT_359607, partial [Aspergillus steynii IBT 23096]